MTGAQTVEEILGSLIPTLPRGFTRKDVEAHWPEGIRPPGEATLYKHLNYLCEHRRLRRIDGGRGRGSTPQFTHIRPRPQRQTPMEVKWTAFKRDPQGYLDNVAGI